MIKYNPGCLKLKKSKNYIITLDIETTSLYEFPEGWRCFDYGRRPAFYEGLRKAAVPYIWMIGIDDKVFYGREFMQLEDVLREISYKGRKRYIYVHNLSFEFQFLRDILERYTVSGMLCRAARHPIAFTVEELNIQFRCSYMLTNLSLEKAAERYTKIRKKSGDLDYNMERSPRTDLTDTELSYCEYDILTLYEIIKYFKGVYGNISRIPYTQTGEVRRAFRKRVGFKYIRNIAKSTPSAPMYLIYNKAFWGGMTHGNCLYVGDILPNCGSYDIASSYPTTMLLPIFPQGKFRRTDPEQALKLNRNKWAVIFHVCFGRVEACKLNHYILNSKIISGENLKADNGRLVSGDNVEMILTDIDYDIIVKSAYKCYNIRYIAAYTTIKGYLPKELINFTLELYEDKTKLKGVAGQEDFYMKQKQMLNGLFGCAVTNIIKQAVKYEGGEWVLPDLTPELVEEKLQELRESKSNCFKYIWGVYITATARARLWSVISKLDAKIVYYDTDSVKYIDNSEVHEVIREENDLIRAALEESAKDNEIDFDRYAPADPEGNRHLIGLWEDEGLYHEFITLGAKRYAYRDTKGLHTVISGVNKKTGYKALKDDIHNFTNNLVFEYDTAGKLASVYNDDQLPFIFYDYQGKVYKSTQKHGVILQPAEYSMSMTEEFETYLTEINSFKDGGWIY